MTLTTDQEVKTKKPLPPLGGLGSSWRMTDPKAGYVYFVGGEEGFIKIGWSGRPEERISFLRTSSPIPLFLLAKVAGPYAMEIEYHRRFAKDRKHGEWFERTPELMAEIERLSQ